MKQNEKMKNVIARCSLGSLGLITEDEPKEIVYPDGNKGFAYVGIHLTDKVAPIGSPWSSRTPLALCRILELEDGGVRFFCRLGASEEEICSV